MRALASDNGAFTVRGTIVQTPVRGNIEVIESALVSIDSQGAIISVVDAASPSYTDILAASRKNRTLIELDEGQYLLPGMVDLHIHAPQWPQMGKALHLPLQEWLRQYTFPLEAKYHDLDFARQSYESLVNSVLANGTTTATYFGTVHLEATQLLADIVQQSGQRAVIGKVAMDNAAQCPDFYRDTSTSSGIDGTQALIEYINGQSKHHNGRVLAAVTPRFIPSCTDDMLTELGRIAKEYDCHVQTHCSESDWEHAYVLHRYGVNDTQSLDRFALLTDKTILAHALLIDDNDMSTIHLRRCGIAHCPLSNLYFSHAVFPARKALDRGLKVGLGTDISGGPSPSVLHNCQVAINVSRALEDGVNPAMSKTERGTPSARIDYRDVFWMATVGGATALGLKVGLLAKGFDFDAIVIDANVADSNLLIWDGLDTVEDVLQKIIYNASRRNIKKVWVQGRLVRSG